MLATSLEQGVKHAQYELGVLFEEGRGVRKNEVEAAKCYRLAAEQGLFEAQYNLGLMLETGRGIGKNEIEAVMWFRKAVEKGNAQVKHYFFSSCQTKTNGLVPQVVHFLLQILKSGLSNENGLNGW